MKLKNAILSLSLLTAGTLCATTVSHEKVKCGNCGAECEVTVVTSTNQTQAPDLDTRPGEMERSTLRYQIAECGRCHYCSADLAVAPKSEAARRVVARPMPGTSLADRFARAAETVRADAEANHGQAGETFLGHAVAGVFFLQAAWSCDDDGRKDKAVEYRRQSAAEFEKALTLCGNDEAGKRLRLQQQLLLCDVYRRAGDFERAEKTANLILSSTNDGFAQQLAKLQLELCRRKDSSRHTLDEIPR